MKQLSMKVDSIDTRETKALQGYDLTQVANVKILLVNNL
jgi:hypothetical protein